MSCPWGLDVLVVFYSRVSGITLCSHTFKGRVHKMSQPDFGLGAWIYFHSSHRVDIMHDNVFFLYVIIFSSFWLVLLVSSISSYLTNCLVFKKVSCRKILF